MRACLFVWLFVFVFAAKRQEKHYAKYEIKERAHERESEREKRKKTKRHEVCTIEHCTLGMFELCMMSVRCHALLIMPNG